MKRRTALQVMAGGVAAEQLGTTQHHLVTLAQAPATYKQRFFSPAENELLERLTEMIIPADDHSLGAGEAKVSLFIGQCCKNDWATERLRHCGAP